MLIHRAPVIARFTRSDATRLGVAAGILILVMTAILGADILPEETVKYEPADIARSDIVAPRPAAFDSVALTEQARAEAAAAVPQQYTYNTDTAIAIAAEQATAFDERVGRVDTAFGAELTPEERTSLLETAVPDLSDAATAALIKIDAASLGRGPDPGRQGPGEDPARRVARHGCGPDQDAVGRTDGR